MQPVKQRGTSLQNCAFSLGGGGGGGKERLPISLTYICPSDKLSFPHILAKLLSIATTAKTKMLENAVIPKPRYVTGFSLKYPTLSIILVQQYYIL